MNVLFGILLALSSLAKGSECGVHLNPEQSRARQSLHDAETTRLRWRSLFPNSPVPVEQLFIVLDTVANERHLKNDLYGRIMERTGNGSESSRKSVSLVNQLGFLVTTYDGYTRTVSLTESGKAAYLSMLAAFKN